MTIGQFLIGALFVVWVFAVIWWGLEGALERYPRRIARQRRIDPDWLASDDTARQVFAAVTRSHARERALIRRGYTTGHQGDGR